MIRWNVPKEGLTTRMCVVMNQTSAKVECRGTAINIIKALVLTKGALQLDIIRHALA